MGCAHSGDQNCWGLPRSPTPQPFPRAGSPRPAAPAAPLRQARPEPAPGPGPLLSPPPGAALRPPSAPPDVTVTGGRRGRCAPLAVPSPGGQVGAGTRERSMEGEKRPRSSPWTLCPAGARSGSEGFQLLLQRLLQTIRRLWKRN